MFDQPDPDDPAVAAAQSAVALARARVHAVHRARMRNQAGNADVARADAELSQALDHLEYVKQATT